MKRLAMTFTLGILSMSLVLAGPAHAMNSVTSNPQNAWVVSELSTSAGASIPASAEVAAYEAAQLAAATKGVATAEGVTAAASVSKPWTMVVNTVAVLGAALFSLPDDWLSGGAPTVDVPSEDDLQGSDACGYASGPLTIDCNPSFGNQSVLTVDGSLPEHAEPYYKLKTVALGDPCPSSMPWQPDQNLYWSAEPQSLRVCGGMWNEAGEVVGRIWLPGTGAPADRPATNAASKMIESTASCRRPDGEVEEVKETTHVFEREVEVPDIECPAGTWLETGKHELVTEDDGVVTKQDVATYDAPDWVREQADRFPECAPVGSVQCQLQLFKISTSLDESDLDCHSVPAGASHPCVDWAADPNKVDNYKCMYGPYPLNLSKCGPYENSFKATPSTRPTTPAEKNTPDPVPPPNLGNDGLGSCKPDSLLGALNPVWVFKAVGCALKWAFVPSPEVWDLEGLRDEFESRAPFSIAITVTDRIREFVTVFTDVSDTSTGCPEMFEMVAGDGASCESAASATGLVKGTMKVFIFLGTGTYIFYRVAGQFR